jgi:hypothetical protein
MGGGLEKCKPTMAAKKAGASNRGRKSKYLEFLKTLGDIMELDEKGLAELLGKQRSNMSDYMKGRKDVRKDMLHTGLEHMQSRALWSIEEDEVMLSIRQRSRITTRPGIYFIYDSSGHCIYLGQASNLRVEVSARLNTKKLRYGLRLDSTLRSEKHSISEVAAYVTSIIIESPLVRHNMEALYLRTMINGTHNGKLGNYRE